MERRPRASVAPTSALLATIWVVPFLVAGCDTDLTAFSDLNLAVEDIGAPSMPHGLAARQVGVTVELKWQAAIDNVGVAGYGVYRDGSELAMVEGTEYVDSAVLAAQAYQYAVTAIDAAGNESGASSQAAVSVQDVTPPSVPQDVVASQEGTGVAIAWRPSTDDVGVGAYELSRNGALLAAVADTTYLDTQVVAGAAYSYGVNAVDAAGNSSGWSDEAAVGVQDLTPPSVPQDVTASQAGTAVELTWRPSTDDVGVGAYELHRDGLLLATVVDTSFVDTTVVATASYVYGLIALDAAGNASDLSEGVGISVADVTPPAAPQALSGSQVGDTVVLAWRPAADDVGVTRYVVLRDGLVLAEVADTAYADGSVAPATSYAYTVAAADAAGNTGDASGALIVAVADVNAPGVPQGVVGRQTGTAVELEWRAPSDDVGVTGYLLYRDGLVLAEVVDTIYLDPTVAAEVTYTYAVAARDAAGNIGQPSAELTVVVADVTAPGAPERLVALQTGAAVRLDWAPASDDVGVTEYVLYRDGLTLVTVTDTAYVDAMVEVDATYSYAVAARDGAGNTGDPGEEVVVVVADVTVPTVPQGLSGSQVGTAVHLDWDASTDDVGVTAYRVYRDGQVLVTVVGTAHVDGTVVANRTYGYSVEALDAAGNASGVGNVIMVPVVDVTAPSVPQGLTGSQVGTAVDLDWQASTDDVGVTDYRVYRNGQLRTTVTGTGYLDGSVVASTTYSYEVSARDAAGNESARSASVAVTVQPPPGQIELTNITNGTTGGPAAFGGHAVSFADVTGDDRPDLYVTIHRNDQVVSDLFYRNLGGGSFVEEGASRGIDDTDFGSHGAVWADLDNDGDYDLYNGATGDVSPTGSASDVNRVYRRDGNGSFTDVTPAGSAAGATRGVLALDQERDGDLDLFAVNGWQGQGDDQPTEQFNEIYRNDGGLQFTYLSSGAFQAAPAGQGATGSDYDGDGDVDVFASNQGPLNVLENVGGSFVQRAASTLGISAAHEARDGVTTADVNNDGHVDLLLASNDAGHLYLNDGDGTFTHRQSFSATEGYMGGFADLDHDGDLDLVFAGDDRVWVNDGSGSYPTSVSFSFGGVDDPRSIAFADIDNDGDLDFFVTQKRTTNRLIRNDYTGSGRWLKVRLRSPQGQAGAFGATVRAYAAGTNTLLGFREARGAYGYVAQDDPVLHFGLGGAQTVDIVVSFLDGSQRTRTDVSTNRTVTIGP